VWAAREPEPVVFSVEEVDGHTTRPVVPITKVPHLHHIPGINGQLDRGLVY
jgi:hypothetical protein